MNFTPGQAADISINKDGWKKEIRPFTFTCVPEDDFLEFTIKTNPSHKGVTPFISILRELHRKNLTGNNMLIFANKTTGDIINENEFSEMPGKNIINILSQEKTEEYYHGHINEEFLKQNVNDFSGYFYVCGPPSMMDAVEQQLSDPGVKEDKIFKDEF